MAISFERVLGDIVRRERLAHRLTLAELGRGARVSPNHIRNIELGRVSARLGVVCRILDCFGYPFAQLGVEYLKRAVKK